MADWNHGTAKLKKDIIYDGRIVRHQGETGVITAFLPEDGKYAVIFDGQMGPDNWFNFSDVETFNEYFEYELQ